MRLACLSGWVPTGLRAASARRAVRASTRSSHHKTHAPRAQEACWPPGSPVPRGGTSNFATAKSRLEVLCLDMRRASLDSCPRSLDLRFLSRHAPAKSRLRGGRGFVVRAARFVMSRLGAFMSTLAFRNESYRTRSSQQIVRQAAARPPRDAGWGQRDGRGDPARPQNPYVIPASRRRVQRRHCDCPAIAR